MAERRDFLVELGTEELPPTALRQLRDDFAERIVEGLRSAGLEPGAHHGYASPRRLAVLVRDVRTRQPDQDVERRGPSVAAAFDEQGQPTRAATGFASSCGSTVDALERLKTDKGEWLVYRGRVTGQPAPALIPHLIQDAIARLPVPKRMRWGSEEHAFVRPVHWLVVLLGDDVIDVNVLGVVSGRHTRGHRFHAPEALSLSSAADYTETLYDKGWVMVDFEQRRERILEQARAAAAGEGGEVIIEDALLDEVTALVEWPVAIVGGFEQRFLQIPPEALVSSMQGHQRYFPIRDAKGRLMPRFVTIANIESRDPSEVVRGNERVIRPRLSDAEFFWDQDKRKPLTQRIESLKEIVFQQALGTLYDKAVRVAALARQLAPAFGVSADVAEQAAFLARCDLLTEMVGEFPELQGTMGRYYAEHDGLAEGIPAAMEEQYRPRFAGDAIPATPLGQVLAVAERVDTLLGIFAIGQAPTGDRDPFALRRAGLGLMRILVEANRSLSLQALLESAADHMPVDLKPEAAVEPVFDFCLDRLKGYYLDRGFRPELFEAVRAVGTGNEDADAGPIDDPVDFDRRLRACADFLNLEAAASLAAANKRVKNILRKAGSDGRIPGAVDPDLFEQQEERQLHAVVQPLTEAVTALARKGDYQASLEKLADVREAVDAFFDKVMVMADAPAVRTNRLALLGQLARLFSSVADISRLPGR